MQEIQAIPIFIITCDRLAVLEAAVESYTKLSTPIKLIIHDNNSTYKPLLHYLQNLEQQGTTVYYQRTNVLSVEDLNGVCQTISDWFENNDAPYYVVTDPDIALCDDCPDILELYGYLLDTFTGIEVVGPMLRIDDIPDTYPLKTRAIEGHYGQFWHKTPLQLVWKNETIDYQMATIDTTFGMYRKGFKFHRLSQGMRTYSPYWARHLDWYLDPNRMTEDQRYYTKHASTVSHWGGTWLKDELTPQPLKLLKRFLQMLER
jgi:hypothetical protein